MANLQLVKHLKKKFPQFKNNEISNLVYLFFNEIEASLKIQRPIELRDFLIFKTKILKENKAARDPRSGELVYVPERKSVKIKMSKKIFNDLNAK